MKPRAENAKPHATDGRPLQDLEVVPGSAEAIGGARLEGDPDQPIIVGRVPAGRRAGS